MKNRITDVFWYDITDLANLNLHLGMDTSETEAWHRPVRARALRCGGLSKGRALAENSNSNDDNGAGQIAMRDDLFGWPGDGVHWTWQRCGRYKYRKVLMHSTNPDHLVPSAARGSGGFLRLAARYAAGRKRCSTTN